MPDDAPRHLESLTVGRLKSVAQRYNVDVGACKHKKDFVSHLAAAGITEAQVSEVLAEEPHEDKVPEVADIKRDIAAIAEKITKGRTLPAREDAEVEANIDRILLARPSFFEIDSRTETAWNHMIVGDYNEALKVISDTRSKMLDRFSSFQIFSCALSIRASESILNALHEARRKTDPSLATALAEAKKAFIEGSPKHREQTLEELEMLTLKAYEAFFEGSTKAEAELRAMLSDYESFGTQTHEPRRLLEIAEQARQSYNVAEYARLLDDAKRATTDAKTVRAKEIERSFGLVRSAVYEAREVGAVLSVGDHDLKAAKEALDDQAFRRAVDLLASVERAADQAHSEKLRDNEVRQRQTIRVSQTITGLEDSLREAASYGLDVQEGLLFVTKAKGALAERDIVAAAKFTRHLKDGSGDIDKRLDKERIERGVAKKVEDAKCGKCGKKSLYSFPNDVKKCVECGHSFSMTVEPRPTTMTPIEKPVTSSGETPPGAGTSNHGEVRRRKLLSK